MPLNPYFVSYSMSDVSLILEAGFLVFTFCLGFISGLKL
jgi:hypothetical protein